MKKKSESGLLSLEASIVVTIFIFLMLFLYSFFIVFEARNEMAHALLATTQSLSLDRYGSATDSSGNISQILSGIYHWASPPNEGFVSAEKWNKLKDDEVEESTWNGKITVSEVTDEDVDKYGENAAQSSLFADTVRDRFIAYLGGKNEAAAEKVLKRLHIVGGVDGLDFSGTEYSSGTITVHVTYKIEYEFDVFNLGSIAMEHSACSKIWE